MAKSASSHIGLVMVSAALLLGCGTKAAKESEAGPITDPDARSAVESYNRTALDLYSELRGKAGNIVISPYSIGFAMSMALSGARGETEKEMAAVLNQKLSRERMESACAKILQRMSRFDDEDDITLTTANALCLTVDGSLVHKPYKQLLVKKYSAELFSAPDVAPINAWVSKKTNGKIGRILKKLSPNSVCVLLNAVYFKGLWASQFEEKMTRPGDFHLAEDKTASVPMMNQTAEYSVVRDDGFAAISMPYKGSSLAMVIILPNDRAGLAAVEKKLGMDMIRATLDGLSQRTPGKVMLSLPRFQLEFGADLTPAFKALGVNRAFSAEKADFGGITGRDDLGLIWISAIQHKAFLEVNEEGSEAAAATAVEFATRSAPRIDIFRADHPFLFLLVDKEADVILFMGRVTDPRG